MTDQPTITPPASTPPPPPPVPACRRIGHWFSARTLCLLIMLTATAWMIALLIRGEPVQVAWIAQIILAMAALLSSAWVSFEQFLHWRKPARRLVDTIEQIRAGKAPIDELSSIGGGIAPIARSVQTVFSDLRTQKADCDRLEREFRHRVARRTDALERMLAGVRQQAERDALTGLLNRRALDAYLPQLIDRCRTDRTRLSLLMLDIDNFKLVNDTLGHAAGDGLLRDVAGLIRSGIRGEDLAFRYGGDEFVILLPDMAPGDVHSLAERLGAMIDELARTIHTPLPPRPAIGIAAMDQQPHPTATALLQQADQSLYAEKSARKSVFAA